MAQNYRCSECGNEFNTEEQLEQHNRLQHGAETRLAGSEGSRQEKSTQRGERIEPESGTEGGNR